jgi:L-aminopeptidase/D-esterase-like protein
MLAQRGNVEGHDAQSIGEVVAKGPGLDLLLQVAARRGHHAHIDGGRLLAAQAPNHTLLQHAKQLDLQSYPAGLIVEEFIVGRELSVPFLEAHPQKYLAIVEHTFDLERLGTKYNVYDYEMKQGGESAKSVGVECPATLDAAETTRVQEMAKRVFAVMKCPDFGRVDIRLHENGKPYFIELNPLPSLHPVASLMTSAKTLGLERQDVLRLIVRSAARRYGLALRRPRKPVVDPEEATINRPTARELGVTVGRFRAGVHNAITDVKGVMVGHVTNIASEVKIPGQPGTTSVRTGVTAILPAPKDIYNKRLAAGGFVLNGVGEMAGLTQVLEWGWLETPILLTNSMSVGKVHQGVVSHMLDKHPKLGRAHDVVLPVVGETDDSFLNDVRAWQSSPQDARDAIAAAKGGVVRQGSVGAGTGMITCDFAGGIGTSSRTLPDADGGFTVGVLVLSNFGRVANLTIDGAVVGRELDASLPQESRRQHSYGSIIVVVATDAPLLSSQLNRLSRRAALGLGRVGSHAASTSGEIVVAFSTANRTPRTSALPGKFLQMRFIADAYVNPLYEAVIEATEEAVLNAIFCSHGMSGREGREAPAIPQEQVLDALRKGREIHACH